ncbi:MAG: hypothetical protein PXX77_08450 [Gallionella sp.]|nr:hypothetical protein [Gallionella sp.]
MQKPLLLIASILAIAHGASHAASGADSKFEINPVVIDSKNGTGSTVGIEYKVKGDLLSKSFDSKDSGGMIDSSATISSALIGYSANGTIAASKDRNPKNFLEFQLDAKLRRSDSGKGALLGSLFAKYETNQSFDNKQLVYGLGGIYGKYASFAENDFIAFDANYGRVDPKDDAERKQVLGGASLDPYYRWNLEFLYLIPIQSAAVKSLEFNYRFFKENNAPTAIKIAVLDTHQLATVRIGLKNDLFLAYSAGKLPFDRKNDQIFQIGFSYNFQK